MARSAFLALLAAGSTFPASTAEGVIPPKAEAAGDDFMSMSLDQLTEIKVDTVYGASKHVQKVTEAPVAASTCRRSYPRTDARSG